MNEHERKNLEEMLSGYIDGELSERQCNEVKRLISHNEQAAAMLNEMQKYKALMGSLPRAQALRSLLTMCVHRLNGACSWMNIMANQVRMPGQFICSRAR